MDNDDAALCLCIPGLCLWLRLYKANQSEVKETTVSLLTYCHSAGGSVDNVEGRQTDLSSLLQVQSLLLLWSLCSRRLQVTCTILLTTPACTSTNLYGTEAADTSEEDYVRTTSDHASAQLH